MSITSAIVRYLDNARRYSWPQWSQCTRSNP